MATALNKHRRSAAPDTSTQPSWLVPCTLLAAAMMGCARQPPEGTPGRFEVLEVGLQVPVEKRDVDILFVIDNSGSMGEEQGKLAAAMEILITRLESQLVGANYHIGVTTTDNGNPWCQGTSPESGALRLTSCRSRPMDFVFEGSSQTIDETQRGCYDRCPPERTNIDIQPSTISPGGDAIPRSWVENIDGVTNLPEGLSTVQALPCLIPQGINGCGFESHLESMVQALDRSEQPGDPSYGFIRPNAVLAIIIMTDEADCSYSLNGETIFLPDDNRVFWSDMDAPAPTSAVCWNAGVACSGSGTYSCSAVDLDAFGNEVSAASAASANTEAMLHPLSRYIDRLQQIEDDERLLFPDREVLVSVIAGTNLDGTITYQDTTDPAFMGDFGIGPGCSNTQGDGEAIPPVRLAELASAFAVGEEPNMFSICDLGYGTASEAIVQAIADEFVGSCIPACVADTDTSTVTLDASCTISYQTVTDPGPEPIPIPACSDIGGAPTTEQPMCHEVVTERIPTECTMHGWNAALSISEYQHNSLPADAIVTANCELAADQDTMCLG